MRRPEAGVSMPDQPNSNEQPTEDETLSPLNPERAPSRRLLHVALALMVAVPAVVWLLRSPTSGEGEVPGGVEIDEVAPDFTLELFEGGPFTLAEHLTRDADRW